MSFFLKKKKKKYRTHDESVRACNSSNKQKDGNLATGM